MSNHQEKSIIETKSAPNNLLSRRALLTGAGLLGSAGLTRVAQAQDAMPAADPAMPGAMPGTMPGTMMAPAGATMANPFGDLVKLATDIDIFNFALILEYLEADFYNRAVAANTRRTFLKGRVMDLAQKLASDENTHVAAITTRIQELGGTPVAAPGFQFPSEAFISEVAFLDLAGVLEQNGVHAYLGAAPKVKTAKNLRFAASIYGIEARHTSLIRFYSGRTFAPDALEEPLPASEIAQRSTSFIISAPA